MKTLKLILPIFLFMAILACKKSAVNAPEDKEETNTEMDIRQYIITGEYTFVLGNKSFIHPILMAFNDGGKADLYDFAAAGTGHYSYTFSNNTLSMNYGGNSNWEFKISNESIVSATGISASIKNFKLYRVPPTNQFTGNAFSGMLSARENAVMLPFKYIFNETQFGEANVSQPELTYAYTVVKNLAAVTIINQVIRYFLVIDGKLTVSRYDLNTEAPAKFFYGTLSRD